VSAHSGQFQKVLAEGGQIDKDRVGKLKESWADLESQVDEKKLFVTAGLELQQVITSIFINIPNYLVRITYADFQSYCMVNTLVRPLQCLCGVSHHTMFTILYTME